MSGFSKQVRIVVTRGVNVGRSVILDRGELLIGTWQGADLRLSDSGVDAAHLRLSKRTEGVHIRDLGSGGGTWLGPLRINDAVLTHSSVLTLGDTTIAIEMDDAQAELPRYAPTQFGAAIGESTAMRKLFVTLEQVASEDVSVLLVGESGVGKDVLANAIHASSKRAGAPFVVVDCRTISVDQVASDLFAQAEGGTLFLDEVGDLPLPFQVKLLRALESRDVRIVAATTRDLSADSSADTFRKDLYYRLAGVTIDVPALRHRTDDIVPLARFFLRSLPGRENDSFPTHFEAKLLSHTWPGNVRELKNAVDRYAVLGDHRDSRFVEDAASEQHVDFDELARLPYREARARALEHFERGYVPRVLARTDNVVVRAAQHAGVARESFHRMLGRIRQAEAS